MVELALERDNDSTGDQPFFPTSEPGFDESKLSDVRQAPNETVPFVQGETIPFVQKETVPLVQGETVKLVQGDREYRFHEGRAATDIPRVAFDDLSEDPEDEEVRSGDYGSETRVRSRLRGETDRMVGLESIWDIGFMDDELLVPVPDIFYDDTQLLDIPLLLRGRRQDETLSFIPALRGGLREFPTAIDIPVLELFDDPEGDPEEEEEVLTPVEVKRTAFSSRSS
jgi:hypothetical protein